MLEFPLSTHFNKRIPKQKFYSNLSVASYLEKLFVKEIDSIVWKYKLSEETLNINAGSYVKEIEIIEITLKEKNISQNVIEFIDREIPYHIVFILKYQNKGQLCLCYKEESQNREGKFKVDTYYKTDWQKYEGLSLEIVGLDLDNIYENFLIQVSDGMLDIDEETGIKEAVEKAKRQEKLRKYIEKLENKIKNEKQFNQQVKLMGKLRKAKEELNTN
ncbi:MAG: DUF4391 domain-containing protein [Tissierellia bacterium]|nr:DUF4391 domain-containing protein [Tissierellia bacterium]MDD4677738.1 DUF4391 domain-containing protein [Tissierellia bacterium]